MVLWMMLAVADAGWEDLTRVLVEVKAHGARFEAIILRVHVILDVNHRASCHLRNVAGLATVDVGSVENRGLC